MKHEYRKLRRKILLRVLLIAALGLTLWMLLQQFYVANIAHTSDVLEFTAADDGRVSMSPEMLGAIVDYMNRQQGGYLLVIGILAVLLVVFYYTMMRLTRYFRETRDGVDKLLLATSEPIVLSPEMDFMQAKLNDVKAELARREAEARSAEKRKDELVAYLAHDIRTPLTTVIGYLNLMSEQPAMPPAQRAEYLGLTLESANRLEALVNEFFEITRFNAQGIHLDLQEFDVGLLLRQLADSFYPMLEPQGKRIEIDVPQQLCFRGDADKLARVFRNILKNAATFSDPDTAIRIEARETGTCATVAITDTGIAIPRQELQAIFDKFHRLDSARSAKTGGAGLGLAIAKEIVLAHGGSISAVSAGSDTTFTVTLPKAH